MATNNYMFASNYLTPQLSTASAMPAAPAAPTTKMGLLGADPSRARADAFLRSLGAMAPGLLMAGAPSTDPGQRGKGLAMAFGAQPQAYQQDLARTRAENVQNINLQMAQAKAAREKALFNQKLKRNQAFNSLLGIPNTAALSQSATTPLAGSGATGAAPLVTTSAQTPPAAVAIPKSQVSVAASNQSQVQIGNVSVPRSVVLSASLTDDPGAEISKFVQKINDPSAEFRPGEQLTRKGRLAQENILRNTLKKPLDFLTELDGKRRAIMAALDQNNGLGDLAAINSYQRLIDDAVVRGEDVRLIQQSQSLVDYFRTMIGSAAEGKKLGDTQRTELRKASKDFISAINGSYVTRLKNVKALAAQDGLRWNAIWQGPSIAFLSGQPAAKPKPAAAPTAPLPTSRNNAPPVGSSNSRFKIPHSVTGN